MKKNLFIYVLLAVLLFVFFIPYIKAEVLTLKYGDEFQLDDFNMITNISYCKVVRYDKEEAEVVYVCKDNLSFYVIFKKSFDMKNSDWGGIKGWEVSYWDSIWSRSGSADSLRWLLYR